MDIRMQKVYNRADIAYTSGLHQPNRGKTIFYRKLTYTNEHSTSNMKTLLCTFNVQFFVRISENDELDERVAKIHVMTAHLPLFYTSFVVFFAVF